MPTEERQEAGEILTRVRTSKGSTLHPHMLVDYCDFVTGHPSITWRDRLLREDCIDCFVVVVVF